jgi:hypothetical protein
MAVRVWHRLSVATLALAALGGITVATTGTWVAWDARRERLKLLVIEERRQFALAHPGYEFYRAKDGTIATVAPADVPRYAQSPMYVRLHPWLHELRPESAWRSRADIESNFRMSMLTAVALGAVPALIVFALARAWQWVRVN